MSNLSPVMYQTAKATIDAGSRKIKVLIKKISKMPRKTSAKKPITPIGKRAKATFT